MNIKQFIFATGLTLFSSQVLSYNDFFFVINDLTIDENAQKLSSGNLLGGGWKVHTPNSSEYMCESSYMPSQFSYASAMKESVASIPAIKADSESYPVFKTDVEGVGFIMGYRQQGTSHWYPITSSEILRQTTKNTEKLFIETRFSFVKTVSGEIKKTSDNRITISSIGVNCTRGDAPLNINHGTLRPSSARVTWKETSCEVKTKRETVDLGTHELMTIRKLRIGDNFGLTRHTMTVDCPANMNVDYSVADNNNPQNIGSDTIYLENQSSFPGFAVQIFESGSTQALKLGGDRKTSSSYQYPFVKTGNSKEVVNKVFDFKYVKISDNVKATDGNAKVTVTLVYR